MKLSDSLTLLSLLANLRLAHWQSPTRTNEHKALGDLYETLDGLVDEYTEIAMGKLSNREFTATEFSIGPMQIAEFFVESLDQITLMQDSLSTRSDADLLNILADMSAAINRTRYLLQIV